MIEIGRSVSGVDYWRITLEDDDPARALELHRLIAAELAPEPEPVHSDPLPDL